MAGPRGFIGIFLVLSYFGQRLRLRSQGLQNQSIYYMVSSELLLKELLNWCNIAFQSRKGKGIPFGKRDVVMIDVTE